MARQERQERAIKWTSVHGGRTLTLPPAEGLIPGPMHAHARARMHAHVCMHAGLLQFLFTLVTLGLAVATYYSFEAAAAWQVCACV